MALYGGAAFGGKSFALLMDAGGLARKHRGFGAVLFRRTGPQLMAEGGLWDTSEEIYTFLGARASRHNKRWDFPETDATITLSHMEYDKNRYDWMGSQIAYIGFDELTHFSEAQFWYLVSRNRSPAGTPCYVRATCNPDPDHFAAKLVAWYIDQDTGLPIPDRAGKVRYFARVGDDLCWGKSKKELRDKYGAEYDPKSFTFIPARLEDNQIGLRMNPGYVSNLMSLTTVERERLRYGNWKIRVTAGSYFRRGWFKFIDDYPRGYRTVRYWDRAATEPTVSNPEPDWTVGTKITRDSTGLFYVCDVVRDRVTPGAVLEMIRNTAEMDGPEVEQLLEKDPGQAGKAEVDYLIRELAAYGIRAVDKNKSKEVMAKPASSQCEAGNILIVRGEWNDSFVVECENFPKGKHDDQVDTLSGGLNELVLGSPAISDKTVMMGPRRTQMARRMGVFRPRGTT